MSFHPPQSIVTSGVASVNGLTGAVIFAAGTGITLTPVLNTVTISAVGNVVSAKVSLSSADILTLNGTPVTIVAAPGAGMAIDLISASARLNYGTTTYDTNTRLHLRNATGTINYLATNNNTLSRVSSSFGTFALAEGANNMFENQALELFVDTGNPATGDGTLDIYVTYTVLTL